MNTGGTGAIILYTGTLALVHTTFSGNTGTNGASLVRHPSFNGTVTVTNTIFGSSGNQCNVASGLSSGGNNISTDATCNLTHPTDKPNTNPYLRPLANNGGPTQTVGLLYNSPALDSGAGALAIDQRLVSRPLEGNGDNTAAQDIGAFEAVNTAPVLDNTGAPTLVSIQEDPAANPGTLVQAMLATGAGGDPISDADTATAGDPDGIALIGAVTTNGSWEYSINGGGSWASIGPVSGAAARLLAANTMTRLRFVPNLNFNGTATVTFRAWDQRFGVNGGTANITTIGTGGARSFSAAQETATITVTPVNDAPTITAIADQSTAEDTPTSAIAFTVGDVETAAGSLTVTGSSSNPTLVPNGNITFGGSGANRTVTVSPAANQSGTTTITVTVSDGSATTPEAFVLTVNAVNDPPTITAIANQVDG